jgi:hypothetical protein
VILLMGMLYIHSTKLFIALEGPYSHLPTMALMVYKIIRSPSACIKLRGQYACV